MAKTPKRPRDPNQLAKMVVDIATGEAAVAPEPSEMAKRGSLGGAIGGKARAGKLTSEERSLSASKAANSRWNA